MTNTPESDVAAIINAEGGYSNNPHDAGGETNWGITILVARAAGYTGAMALMPRQVAANIYLKQYIQGPGFDKLYVISDTLASYLIDTGVNMGPAIAVRFLQRALNLFNGNGTKYKDLAVDGGMGPGTLATLSAFVSGRGQEGLGVLLKTIHIMRGSHYITIAESNLTQEEFIYGWIKNRA